MCKITTFFAYMQYLRASSEAHFINLLEPKGVIMVVIIYALIYLASMICLKWLLQMPNYHGSPGAIDGEGTKAL